MGVSAGFSPIAIGTEVDGSLVQPSARAGLYALKPSIGATELEGIFAVSEDFDAVGTMAKSTLDLALLTPLVLNAQARAKLPSDGYLSFLKKDFSGLKIGFVDAENWRWPEALQKQGDHSLQQLVSPCPSPLSRQGSKLTNHQRSGYQAVLERVKGHGGTVVYPVTLPAASKFMMDGAPAIITAIRMNPTNQVRS